MKYFNLIIFSLLILNCNFLVGQTNNCPICESSKYDSTIIKNVLAKSTLAQKRYDEISKSNLTDSETIGLVMVVSDSKSGFSEFYILIPLDEESNNSACISLCEKFSGYPTEIPIANLIPISKIE